MNVAELTTKLGEIYACVDGPPRAFFELPAEDIVFPSRIPPLFFRRPFRWLMPLARRKYRSNLHARHDGTFLRIRYETIKIGARGEPDVVEPLLCQWAYVTLSNLLTPEVAEMKSVVLFWRRRPEISEFTDNDGAQCTSLRMRLAIPGFNLSFCASPEGDIPIWL